MFFVGGVRSDMLLYYKRGEVSMGLLYCGANIQPTAAEEVCDDGRCTTTARGSRGGIFRTLNAVFFRGIIRPDLSGGIFWHGKVSEFW